MSIFEKIKKAIKEVKHDNTPYTDNYDGFTHWSYEGLVEDVYDALAEDYGVDEDDEINVSQTVVNDYVMQMI
jgi:tRNA U34 5-methylaminomethyl-2-thiouridine-forming methyltransferase MnmC